MSGRTGRATRPRRRANLGATLEAALDEQHRRYAAAGLAFVQRLPVPVRHVGAIEGGDGRSFEAVRAARSTTDFAGVIGQRGPARGRAVFIEAKSCGEDRCPFTETGNTRGGLRPHQERALAAVAACGGFGLVVVKMPAGIWVVDVQTWRTVAALPTLGRVSWSPALLDEHGLRVAGPFELRVDWLAALVRVGLA